MACIYGVEQSCDECRMCGKRAEKGDGKKKSALWKYDRELGIAFFCPDCKKFVCASGMCECGAEIDLSLPKVEYKGKVKF